MKIAHNGTHRVCAPKPEWGRQIRAVMRLEMRKTFFARRGLWVYLLAFAPVLLFMGHAMSLTRERGQRQAIAAAHPVSSAALRSIQPGLTREEVIAQVGEPYSQRRFRIGRRRETATLFYTDGEAEYDFIFLDDQLTRVGVQERVTLQQDTQVFATVFQFFYLRLAVFFGCVGIFMNLFRGEMIDKSLHFYLLAPIRREILLLGKYLAGLIATVAIFTVSTALQLWMLLLPYDKTAVAAYLNGPGWGHIGWYLGVTALACLGYGSVFLAAGLLFKNPMIAVASVLLWEQINPFLPAALKKISVIFYLQSLCPVVARPGSDMSPLLALLIESAEPTPAALAIGGLLVVTLAVLAVACLRARKLEINYGTD